MLGGVREEGGLGPDPSACPCTVSREGLLWGRAFPRLTPAVHALLEPSPGVHIPPLGGRACPCGLPCGHRLQARATGATKGLGQGLSVSS